MESLVREFLEDYKKNRHPYIAVEKDEKGRLLTEEELVNMLTDIEMVWRDNPDELVSKLVESTIIEYERVRNKYNIPGYIAAVQVGNISVGIFGGKTNSGENAIDMPEDALFDIASMTKLYTQIVAYNLMAKGLFKLTDKVKDIDKRFTELDDVTIGDILSFAVAFRTPGRIDDAENSEEALGRLFGTTIARDKEGLLLKGYYDYNDIGMMILKEVMEEKTHQTLEDLIKQYILKPLNLENTYLKVPENKHHLVTGTSNFETARVNDPKANMMVNGYSGHAGVFSAYFDAMKVLRATRSGIILPNNHDFITPGNLYKMVKIRDQNTKALKGIKYTLRNFNAKVGSVFLSDKGGVNTSWVPNGSPEDSIGTSGSTRVTGIASLDSSFITMQNVASVSVEEARETIERINEENRMKGINKIFDLDNARVLKRKIAGKDVDFNFIETKALVDVTELENMTNEMGRLTIQLRFLDFIMRKYDKNYEIDYKKRVA